MLTTGGTAGEARVLRATLGAEVAINYRDEDFVEVVQERTDGHGADVILDNMGASYLGRNVDALATEGRLVVIGMQGGTQGRARPQQAAAQARRGHRDLAAGPAGRGEGRDLRAPSSSTSGRWSPTGWSAPSCTAPCRSTRSAAAHALMESGDHMGKILLTT